MTAAKHRRPTRRPLPTAFLVALVVVLTILLAVVGGAFAFEKSYRQRVFPGIRLGSTKVSGLSYVELLRRLEEYDAALAEDGLSFRFRDHTAAVTSTLQAPDDPDLARELISLDAERTANDLYAFGRRGTFWRDQQDRFLLLMQPRTFTPYLTVNEEALTKVLEENFAQFETPATSARLAIGADGAIRVEREESGTRFDWAAVLQTARHRLASLSSDPIDVQLIEDAPTVRQAETDEAVAQARAVLTFDPLVLRFDDREWTVPKETLRSWLTFGYDRRPILALADEQIRKYFDRIAGEIEIAPQEGKFSIDRQTGKVTEFQASRVGRMMDRAATQRVIAETYLAGSATTVAVVMQEAKPSATVEAIADLGIKEIIGVGKSNMKGSPKNRRHNIAVGAATLHGLLIKPDEEFSLVKALGVIEASTGYLPELVIKGNRTIPEYGGGLCQIGTTTFRAAMGSGLPITERRNHSYSVSYYLEDGLPGTDATIYPPHPDFRFVNDTGHAILIQTRIEGDDIIFEFWGTKDGRVVTRTKPTVSNRVSPPPTKIVETTDLKPGERKCTEKPHAGLNAQFTYTVRYPSGEEKAQTFSSRYKPWQEVCLVGKAA